MTLSELQAKQGQWQDHNFPDSQAYQCLLGVVEETGELAHAHLKGEQEIRATKTVMMTKAKDAVGDIVIFLAGYCSRMGFDLEQCVENAWEEVSLRDWKKHRAEKQLEEQNEGLRSPEVTP